MEFSNSLNSTVYKILNLSTIDCFYVHYKIYKSGVLKIKLDMNSDELTKNTRYQNAIFIADLKYLSFNFNRSSEFSNLITKLI